MGNMVRRRRRHRSSSLLSWIFLFVLLLGGTYAVWRIAYTPEGEAMQTDIQMEGEKAPLIKIENGKSFLELRNITKLWEKESLQTTDASTTLSFFNGSTITLDTNTIVRIEKARYRKEEQKSTIRIVLEKGRLWGDVVSNRNPKSNFSVVAPHFVASTKGATFSLDEYSVVVFRGLVTVSVGDKSSVDVDVGQELVFSEEDIRTVQKTGMFPQKNAISDIFRKSSWFAKNTKKGNQKRKDEIQKERVDITPEEHPKEAIEIVTPGKNNEIVLVRHLPARITGKVPAGTEKVMVNGFVLSKFSPGDIDFLYLADPKWNTLSEGKNEYTIVAIAKDGTRHEASITLVYHKNGKTDIETQEMSDEKKSPTEAEAETTHQSEETGVETGILSITSPKDGAIITDSEIVVSGIAPSNAAKIVVDGYTLKKFTKGKAHWTYIIADRLGNRPVGKHAVQVKAFDENGTLIAQKSITLTFRERKAYSGEAEIRDGTLPPVQSDNLSNPTI